MDHMERFVRRYGENLLGDNDLQISASLVSSTNATSSLGSRAYYFQGLSTLGGVVGSYLKRQRDNLIYLIETIQPDPAFPSLQMIYLVQCNATVSLLREVDSLSLDQFANPISSFVTFAENVAVYKDSIPRDFKAINAGLIDQTNHIVHIPHRFHVKSMDRLCVWNSLGVLLQSYRVESVSDTLTPIDSSDQGVDLLRLSQDMRPIL